MTMTRLLAAAAICGTLVAPASVAAPVVHDSPGAFGAIVYSPGTNNTFGTVAAQRQVIGNLFDASNTTLLSLGLGGSLDLLISPADNVIIGSTVFELTNLGSGHKERARIFLGNDLGDWIEVGQLLNQELGSQVTNVSPAVAVLEVTAPGAATGFSLTVLDGSFNSLRLVDASPVSGGYNLDGFDIATLFITSTAPTTTVISEPGAMVVLSVALLGLVATRRSLAAA